MEVSVTAGAGAGAGDWGMVPGMGTAGLSVAGAAARPDNSDTLLLAGKVASVAEDTAGAATTGCCCGACGCAGCWYP